MSWLKPRPTKILGSRRNVEKLKYLRSKDLSYIYYFPSQSLKMRDALVPPKPKEFESA